jgi:hypothetical protein
MSDRITRRHEKREPKFTEPSDDINARREKRPSSGAAAPPSPRKRGEGNIVDVIVP